MLEFFSSSDRTRLKILVGSIKYHCIMDTWSDILRCGRFKLILRDNFARIQAQKLCTSQ